MPVHCGVEFPRLTDEEMRALDYQVMGLVFEAHGALGRLCDECVYQGYLLDRLRSNGLATMSEVPITVSFGDFSIRLSLDLVVLGRVIYELKTVSSIARMHVAQLLNYLYLTNSSRGKLINFRQKSVNSRFVNTSLDHADRSRFDFDVSDYHGKSNLQDLVYELIKDWGTGLSAPLYRRAVLRNYLCEYMSEQSLAMEHQGRNVGHQRFHLLAPDIALGVTTFDEPLAANRREFTKMIAVSPIREFHWLNITHRRVSLLTINNHSSD